MLEPCAANTKNVLGIPKIMLENIQTQKTIASNTEEILY